MSTGDSPGGDEPNTTDAQVTAEDRWNSWFAAQQVALNSADPDEARRTKERLSDDARRLWNTRVALVEVALHGPGLGLAAQAFLFVVIFSSETPPIGRVAAALVALLAAYASAKAAAYHLVVSWRLETDYDNLRRIVDGDAYIDGLDALSELNEAAVKAAEGIESMPRPLVRLASRFGGGVYPQAWWLLTIAAFILVDGLLLVLTTLEWAGVRTPLSS